MTPGDDYCRGPNFPRSPADVTSDDDECAFLTTQTNVWVVMDSATVSKRPATTQSLLKSNTKKKTNVLSAASLQSKRNYDQSRAGTRIHIGYAFDPWRRLQLELGVKTDADMAHFLVTR